MVGLDLNRNTVFIGMMPKMNQNRKAIVSGPTRKPGVSTGRWGSISDSSKLDMGLRIDLICNQTSGETTTSLFGAEYAGDRVRWDCRNHSGTRASHAWHSSPQPLEPINQPNRIDLYRSVKAVVPSEAGTILNEHHWNIIKNWGTGSKHNSPCYRGANPYSQILSTPNAHSQV
jgi:hypothetical protein